VSVEVACACGHRFEVGDALSGGVTNCPRCGHAVDVPGLKDPLWRAAQVAAAVAWAGATAVAFVQGGAAIGLLTAAGVAVLLWLLSRAL
jgi:hypothetical protein